MLNSYRFQQYVTSEHQLSAAAIEYITETRTSPPSRLVGVHARTNIVAAEVSTKMGFTVTSESHAERSIITQFELNPDVLEFWDQPPCIDVLKVNKRGSRRRNRYTPDFLVLLTSGPVVQEVKTLEEVEKLVLSDPNNWVRMDSGYDYIPAREAFQLQFGIRFEVVVATRRDQQISENIRILLASRDAPTYDSTLAKEVEKLLIEQPVWRLDELFTTLGLSVYTAAAQLIDVGRLSFDLASASLANPERCYVAAIPQLLSEMPNNECHALEAIQATDGMASVTTEMMPKSDAAKRVLRRLARIQSGEKTSSVRRWKKQVEQGREKGLTPFQALIDSDKNIVGRNAKLAPEVKSFLDYFIDNVALLMRTQSRLQCYSEYSLQSKEVHPNLKPVSTQTFYTAIAKMAPELVGQAIGGKRMSIAMSPPTDPTQRHLAPTLPWMKASLDHCKINLFLVIFEGQDNLYVARPWLSLMLDVATSEVLAFAISFQNPSRRSCAKLIRECVRRHERLPREILIDHGSDFTSVYFRSLLGNYGITHSLRPSGNPRAGSEVERFFGEYREQWLSQRPGYVPNHKTLREIDGKITPDKFSTLTVKDAYEELTAFIEWRSSKPRGAKSQSSYVIYHNLIEKFPFIPIRVEYDEEFVLATSVETSEYKIDFQRGIHIKNLHYYCPQIQRLQGFKSRTEVRIDPENPYVVYVQINNEWCPAYNSEHNIFIDRPLKERISEGVLVYECASFRRNISEQKGVELAGIRKYFDSSRGSQDSNKDCLSSDYSRKVECKEEVHSEEVFDVRDIPIENW